MYPHPRLSHTPPPCRSTLNLLPFRSLDALFPSRPLIPRPSYISLSLILLATRLPHSHFSHFPSLLCWAAHAPLSHFLILTLQHLHVLQLSITSSSLPLSFPSPPPPPHLLPVFASYSQSANTLQLSPPFTSLTSALYTLNAPSFIPSTWHINTLLAHPHAPSPTHTHTCTNFCSTPQSFSSSPHTHPFFTLHKHSLFPSTHSLSLPPQPHSSTTSTIRLLFSPPLLLLVVTTTSAVPLLPILLVSLLKQVNERSRFDLGIGEMYSVGPTCALMREGGR